METFFAAAFTPPAKEGAQEEKKKKKFLLLYCSFDMILIIEFLGKINLTHNIDFFLEIISSFIT